MINKGVSLEEIKRLFEYLEQSKTDNKMQVIMTNDMCKSLYDIYITMYEYQEMIKNRISKAIKMLEESQKGLEEWHFDGYDPDLKEVIKILRSEEDE